MDDPVRHERFVAVGKWVTKKAITKNQDVFFLYQFFHEWYKKIPNSLSIGLYLDQPINLNNIRKADKSRISCASSIKIYREVPETLRNQSIRT